MKSCLDQALAGSYDYLDGVVFTNSCDNLGRCYDLWRLHSKYGYVHFINIPHSKRETAFKVMLHELRRFKSSLEEHFKVEVDEGLLRSAVRLMNEERRLLARLYELRAEDPPPITGLEAFYVVASSAVTPKEEHVEMSRRVIEEPPKPRGSSRGGSGSCSQAAS